MKRFFVLLIVLLGGATMNVALAGGHTTAPDGKTVFDTHCANCHTGGFGGFFSGAPKVGKAADWAELLPKGIDALYASTVAGVGGMEPRGGCTACTDAELRAAVEHMVEQSR